MMKPKEKMKALKNRRKRPKRKKKKKLANNTTAEFLLLGLFFTALDIAGENRVHLLYLRGCGWRSVYLFVLRSARRILQNDFPLRNQPEQHQQQKKIGYCLAGTDRWDCLVPCIRLGLVWFRLRFRL